MNASSTMGVTSGQPTSTQPFTATATVVPASVVPGKPVAVTASVTAQKATTALIDIEIYDSKNMKVYQEYKTSQQLAANQPTQLTINWTPPSGGIGTYTVKIGVFTNDWGTLYLWNDNAGKFTVTSGFTPAPEPTAQPISATPRSNNGKTTLQVVAFTNDFSDSRGDRNPRVDRIIITYPNGTKTTYQTEDPSVLSTGTFMNNSCAPGNKSSEWLHCNGYFQY